MVEIPLSELALVLRYLRPLASQLYLTNPQNGIDKALQIMIGWELRDSTSLGVSEAPSLLSPPLCALQPAASVPASSSSARPSSLDVP